MAEGTRPLPSELILYIIEQYRNDKHTLSLCALVCRDWCAFSWPLLFNRITILFDPYHTHLSFTCAQLCDLLNAGDCCPCASFMHDLSLSEAQVLLENFRNLRSLSLTQLYIASQCPPSAVQAFRLSRLILDDVVVDPVWFDLLKMFSEIQELHAVNLYHITIESLSDGNRKWMHHPMIIRTLFLEEYSNTMRFNFPVKAIAVGAITRISCGISSPEALDHLSSFLRPAVSTNLTHLHIILDYTYCRDIASLNWTSLSGHRQRSFTDFHVTVKYTAEHHDYHPGYECLRSFLRQAIDSLPSHVITHLSIVISNLTETYRIFPWGILDTALERFSKSNLISIVLADDTLCLDGDLGAEASHHIWSNMHSTRSRDILEIVNNATEWRPHDRAYGDDEGYFRPPPTLFSLPKN
ncbi:unnamed protein product [Somion occarium]|uniref:F-box domain-containing protein n=1 Tax=Somion occarium TaxID=3059160 RepID=A0ABP1E6W5_9APHY